MNRWEDGPTVQAPWALEGGGPLWGGVDFGVGARELSRLANRHSNFLEPWNNWYHCMGHTYGTWLPGDPRGFRTRHGREQIVGDYKSPPPKGKYDGLHRYAKSVMKREAIYLNFEQRQLAARFFVESLQRREIDVVTVCVDSVHFHILARFVDRRADHWVGIAKRETSPFVKEAGACAAGGLWGVRAKCQPIEGRGHQLAVAKYILDHRAEGAAVWFRGKVMMPGRRR